MDDASGHSRDDAATLPGAEWAGSMPALTPESVTLLFRDLPEPMLLVSSDNRILAVNRAAEETLGSGLIGQLAHAVIRQPDAVIALERGLAAGAQPTESRFLHSSASAETVFRMSVAPVDQATGLDGALVSFHDIGHVEEAEQMRRDFIANVSHELRSPLTALAGFIETLRGTARDDAAARERFLKIMDHEAGRMTRLVTDLLSLSKVESNERVRPRDDVDLEDAVRATVAALRPQSEAGDIAIRVEAAPPRHHVVSGDRDQLIQVFGNLIENALRYGSAGGEVTVTLRTHPRLPGFKGPVISVEVADRGEGIDPIHIPRLTERFYRVDTHRSREMGGTGLGLAIVKHIVNRHRGRLSIRSARGEGSSFTVLLPAAPRGDNGHDPA